MILEDTDHDGVADSRKVFMEGIAFPAAIAVGMGGVFVGAPPNLLFIPDKNGDDKADVDDIEVRLTGWGIRDRHETFNSLHWGPDGWLYGCQGFATPSKVRKPTGKGRLYRHKDPFPDDLLQGAGVDINGGVWRYHPTKDRFEVVNLPKLIWFGMEPLVKENTSRALDLATRSQIPMVTQFIARRAVDAQAIDALVATIGKLPKNRLNLLEGMRDAVEGRYDLTAPANWKIVYAKLKTDGTTAKLATEITGQFGGTEMAIKSLALLKDAKTPIDSRKKALQALALQQRPELVKELPELLNNADLRPDAIRAIASYDNEPLGKLLLERYAGFNPAEKTEAIQTMASRPKYGWQLTQAIAKNTIPKREVPTYVARQLRRVVGSGFVEVWGPIDHVALDEKAYARYRNLLTDQAVASANPVKGRLVFQNTCGPCHKMYGEGGIIGPDLTGSNRANLDYLLGNILDPSAEIQDDYKMVVVTTRDGRTYVGNVAKENERQLTLRVIGQDAVVVNKSDIQSREVNPASMMPTGLLDPLSETEIKDLVAFLRTTTQAKTLVRKK